MTMTKAEFEQAYSKQVGLSIGRIHAIGMVTIPCSCGTIGCQGWTMRYASAMKDEEVEALPEPYKGKVAALRRRLKSRTGGKL